LERHPAPAPSAWFSFERDGATWHALVHGAFADAGEARRVARTLPRALRTSEPWPRRFRDVQALLDAR
jgi:DamX protein